MNNKRVLQISYDIIKIINYCYGFVYKNFTYIYVYLFIYLFIISTIYCQILDEFIQLL